MTARDDIAAAPANPDETLAAIYNAVRAVPEGNDLAAWHALGRVQGYAARYFIGAPFPADPDEAGAECARCEDAEGGYRVAREAADRFRDVLADCLSPGDENPGDDVLVTKVREHFGRTGPEPHRWRDFMTGAEAMRDQINAAAKDQP